MGYSRGIGVLLAVVLLAVLLFSRESSAESSARARLEEFFQQATAVLSESTDAKHTRADVGRMARALFDGHRAAQSALGAEWDRRTGAERREFARMFTVVLERTYLDMLRARLPRDQPPAIHVTGEDVTGQGAMVVHTTVPARNGGDVQVDYRMTRAGGAWRVFDVVIDDVGLVENYRAQFAHVLRRASYADLSARLHALASPGEAQAAVASPAQSTPGASGAAAQAAEGR